MSYTAHACTSNTNAEVDIKRTSEHRFHGPKVKDGFPLASHARRDSSSHEPSHTRYAQPALRQDKEELTLLHVVLGRCKAGHYGYSPPLLQPARMFFFVNALFLAALYKKVKCCFLTALTPPRSKRSTGSEADPAERPFWYLSACRNLRQRFIAGVSESTMFLLLKRI